ncbi:SMP-30/gluconolactonase/LRE family protein [Streptomyces sp. WMMB 322]|uniref:SMP-30/gluconolactonase/LRE family protein n=1 Tax=Streptomyces sp. WMMB 322 TaxID=1286821 RepID=UPI000823E3BB|nr:SMP-30/gluconolactonase/LRE family protein [Streptomyces sp. WMMB 322]SCK16679.1 NHL repeat-containing protein [Streptomyces sp. WMMB 322]
MSPSPLRDHSGDPDSREPSRAPRARRQPWWKRLLPHGRSWRRRATAMTAVAVLCTAGLGAAPAAPAPGGGKPPGGGGEALYVSDFASNDVQKFLLPEGPQSAVPTTGLSRPTYLAFDRGGALYISDTVNSRIVKVTAAGEQTTVPTEGLLRPLGLALSKAGDLYIADSFNDRVVKVAAGGGQTTVPTEGLLHPDGLALDEKRNELYISDFVNDRVVKVPTGGGAQTTVPTSGLSQPTGLALGPRGDRLYISDSGNNRVVKVRTAGSGQTTVPTSGLASPQGLALDRERALYVADFGNDRVVRVPSGGGGQTTVPLVGLTTPVGLAVRKEPAGTRLEARPATAERGTGPPLLKVRGLSAKLTGAHGRPLAGRTVEFSNASRSKQLCRAVTGKKGLARCEATIRGSRAQVGRLLRDLVRDGYRASFSGTDAHKPATDTAAVRVKR